MKASNLLLPIVVSMIISSTSYGGEQIDRLLAEYSKLETVTCKIRRTREGKAGKIKFLSRVYFEKGQKLHAEKLTPVKQRTISDGTTLFQYTEGSNNLGFSRPIAELSPVMRTGLDAIPGTAMNLLLPLKEAVETQLPTSTPEAQTFGLALNDRYTTIELDALGRLTTLKIFKTAAQKTCLAEHHYSNYSEVIPGVWIALSQRAKITYETGSFDEVVKIDNFTANQPIAKSLFIPTNFFGKNIEFVNNFRKIFPNQ